jgi:hypothetical protein
MIRTAKGVSFEGLDGVDYLKQATAAMPTTGTTT